MRISEKELYAIVQRLADRTGKNLGLQAAYNGWQLVLYDGNGGTGAILRDLTGYNSKAELARIVYAMHNALDLVGK